MAVARVCAGSDLQAARSGTSSMHDGIVNDGSDAGVLVRHYVKCLQVTFLFEKHLMELRKTSFDDQKRCATLCLLVLP